MKASAWIDYDQRLPEGEETGTVWEPGQRPHGPAIFVSGPYVHSTTDYAEDIHRAVQALMDHDPRVAQGHFFSIKIIA